MNAHEQLGILSTLSYQPAEGLKECLPTMRTFMEKTCDMPAGAFTLSVSVATRSREDGSKEYRLEVTFA